MVNLKLELLESQMAKVSFNYTPSKDTKTGSIPSNLFTLSRPSLSANFAIEEHPQINDWFSVPSPPDRLYGNSANVGHWGHTIRNALHCQIRPLGRSRPASAEIAILAKTSKP
jgi:hypothetical protein